MSEFHAATTPGEPRGRAALLRSAIIGNRVTIDEAAEAFGVTPRAIYQQIAKHNIPFVKVFDIRYLDPNDLRAALIAERNTAPRGRGRPRKAA
jgi:hypothetical protein